MLLAISSILQRKALVDDEVRAELSELVLMLLEDEEARDELLSSSLPLQNLDPSRVKNTVKEQQSLATEPRQKLMSG